MPLSILSVWYTLDSVKTTQIGGMSSTTTAHTMQIRTQVVRLSPTGANVKTAPSHVARAQTRVKRQHALTSVA